MKLWKCLLAVCITLQFSTKVKAQVACQNAAGSWVNQPGGGYPDYTWEIQQSVYSLNGDLKYPATDGHPDGCADNFVNGNEIILGTGTMDSGSGGLTFTASCTDVIDGTTFSIWTKGPVQKPGCHFAYLDIGNNAGYTDPNSSYWLHACDIPNAATVETSTFSGWDTSLFPVSAEWQQTLHGSVSVAGVNVQINFGGRTVYEQNPGGGGPDTCYFKGSKFKPFVAVTPNNGWDVQLDSTWGYDYVGYSSTMITYYRSQSKTSGVPALPCGTTLPQKMLIDCATLDNKGQLVENDVSYTTNTLGASFDAVYVYGTRQEGSGSVQSATPLQWP